MSRAAIAVRASWLLYLALFVGVTATLHNVGGCPPGVTDGGEDGNGAVDPNTTGGDTGGGDTAGGDNGGGDTGGGDTGGGGTTEPTSFTLTAIAQTGDPVPDQPAGVAFTEFMEPVVDSEGRVAFWAKYAGSGALGTGGLYVWNGTSLQRVVHDDPATAGTVPGEPNTYFVAYDPNHAEVAWGPGGRLLFTAFTSNGNNPCGVYRWRATDGDLATVADSITVADAFGVTVFIANYFTQPGVSANGLAIFGLNYTYIGGPDPNNPQIFFAKNAVCTSDETTITPLAAETIPPATEVPGQTADYYFTKVFPLATMNTGADGLYQGFYISDDTGQTGRGIYLVRDGVTYNVIDSRTGASWPGLPLSAVFNVRSTTLGYSFANGPADHIAAWGKLSTGGPSSDAVLLYDWSLGTAGEWTQLTGLGGTPATALVSGVNDAGQALVLAGGNPYLSSRTSQIQVNLALPAQLSGASLTWPDNGGAINNEGRAVVPYTNNGKRCLGYWTGSQFLIVADAELGIPTGTSEITTITAPERDRPAASGLLNDSDLVVFRVVQTGDVEAIYVAQGQ